MPLVKLPEYKPDLASTDAAVSSVATNVLARADGYGPVPAPVPVSLALPGACRGAVQIVSPTFGDPVYFAGTATGLYRYNNATTGWDDVGKPGATYSVPPGDSWSFAIYGNRLLATCLGAPVQVIAIDTGTTFDDLAGSPPRARHVGVVGEFAVLAGLAADPNAVQWSDLGDITYWTPGVGGGHTSDLQIFPDHGAVTGFAGGEFGVVFQERAIRRMVFVPNSVEVFDFSVLEEARGAVAPWAIAKAGPRVFFVDREGFFLLADGASSPIGAERVNRTFLARVDPNRIASTIAVRDVTGPRILFSYRSKSASPDDASLLDETLVYDWLLDRWTFLSVPIRYGMAAATLPVSLDSIPGSLDDEGQLPLDDPSYAGGAPALAVVLPDDRLALLSGAPLEAVIETAEAMLARPNRAFVSGARLDSDADDWRVTVGSRESAAQSAPIRLRAETGPTVSRFAPCRASGRYHRFRVRVPAGTAWSFATGIEPEARPEGMR